jgi:predicted RNA binding protein YcfA (HicA-like mRNA interferase family)
MDKAVFPNNFRKPADGYLTVHYKWCILKYERQGICKKMIKDGWKVDRINGSHYIMRKNTVSLSVPVHGNEDLKTGIFNFLSKKAGFKK